MKKKNIEETRKESSTESTLLQATVIQIMNKQAEVWMDGQTFQCVLPGALVSDRNALAVGDQVEIEWIGRKQYKLVRILPRKTALYRGNRRAGGEVILVAANLQCLIAVVTADYLLHQAGFLEAAAIAAKRAGVQVGFYISKWDLIGENAQAILQNKLVLYQKIADFVVIGSAPGAWEQWLERLEGKTAVVIGDRACGKTALIHEVINGTKPSRTMPGTHTSKLHTGPKEIRLIDTPGFRDLALTDITEEERNAVFPEIAELAGGCRFQNCTHTHEEGCLVLAGLREKRLQRERYDIYQKMSGVIKTAVPKTDYRHTACMESFTCKVCGTLIVPEGAGSQHRNHCPKCLSSIHVDEEPGDRASLCHGIMDPVSVWVRKNGEWAMIHRCRLCGALSANRIAADDNPALLMSIAVKPLAMTPFPLSQLDAMWK